jgi:hypothetical protein
MDNFDYLSEVFNDYCIKHKLPLNMSADDILHGNFHGTMYENENALIDLTEEQIQWIRKFIEVWENLTS